MIRCAKLTAITSMLLFLITLGGCASTKEAKPLVGEQLHRELTSILIGATYGMDTTTVMANSVEELLPANALPMNQIAGIPLFEEQLARFKDEVNSAFLSVAWETAPLLEPIILTIPWSDDQALIASLRSGTALLERVYGEEILTMITPILSQALNPATNRWTAIIDWYLLYRESVKLLEIDVLPMPDENIEEHLALVYLERYFEALGDEEHRLRARTTEVR
jgi:hypothetical protein